MPYEVIEQRFKLISRLGAIGSRHFWSQTNRLAQEPSIRKKAYSYIENTLGLTLAKHKSNLEQ